MPRPIQATIHNAALHHNLERVRQSAADARVWAVVKANAYGHGIERRAARALQVVLHRSRVDGGENGARHGGVNTYQDGRILASPGSRRVI